MNAERDLGSIEGVEVDSLVRLVDGTVFGAVRLRGDLPLAYARIKRQGWTIARTADEAPAVADLLNIDPVPTDVLLVERDTDAPLIENVR